MPLSKKDKIFTYEDYQAWPDEEHWEIIDSSAYLMAPPSRIHQEISRELLTSFSVYLKDKPCRVYSAPFSVRFPSGDEKKDEDIKTVVEPDISVVCDESKLDDKGCKSSPDLIIEIVSPTSARRDKVEKFNLYERCGVKEYWLVEQEEKVVVYMDLDEFNRWYGQAMHTVNSAYRDFKDGDYSWACFKAQQAAEFAIKALLKAFGVTVTGHSLVRMENELAAAGIGLPTDYKKWARKLDRDYILSRCPDAYPSGSPFEYYDMDDAKTSIQYAQYILNFVEESLTT